MTSVVVVALLLVLSSPSANAAKKPPCPVEGQIIDRGKGWTSVMAPDFPAHPVVVPPDVPGSDQADSLINSSRASGVEIDPAVPGRVFLHDRFTVMRTDDGGCTWANIFELPDAPSGVSGFNKVTTRITGIVVTPPADGPSYVYITVNENAVHNGLPISSKVLRSRDGGESWEDWSQGLLPGHSIDQLVVAPSDPETAYLLATAANSEGPMFRRRPGSASWEQIRSTADEFVDIANGSVYDMDRLAVDPQEPDSLWRWSLTTSNTGGAQPPQFSSDGGQTWTTTISDYNAQHLSIRHEPGRAAEIIVTPSTHTSEYRKPYALYSDDGGESFDPIPLVDAGPNMKPVWIDFGSIPGSFVGWFDSDSADPSVHEGLFRLDPRSKKWVPLPLRDDCAMGSFPSGFPQSRDRSRRPSLHFLIPPPDDHCRMSIAVYSGRF